MKTFPNTFIPWLENKHVSIDAITKLLPLGLKYSSLPDEVKEALEEEMSHRNERQKQEERLR